MKLPNLQHTLDLISRLSILAARAEDVRPLFSSIAAELIPFSQARRIMLSRPPGNLLAVDSTALREVFDLPRESLPENLSSVSRLLRISEPAAWLSSHHARAAVVVPLLIQNQSIGTLCLGFSNQGDADDCDAGFLEAVAAMLALAIDRRQARVELALLQSAREHEPVLQPSKALTQLSNCPGLKSVCEAVEMVAASDSTVLIAGETGTGKELVAEAIHESSPRRGRLLVRVNCAALPRELIAAELFGHEAGAFTGAGKRRLGRFELAQQGTLFLDEIAEISAETQVTLLRVLQARVIERIGGTESIPVDVRIVAATNRDLLRLVQDGSFRADLFYRLNVFPMSVPPLRNRRDDIPRLIEHFLTRFNARLNKKVRRVAPSTLNRLLAYHWPGNIRELENLIERAMIMVAGDTLAIDPDWLSPLSASDADAGISIWTVRERQAILEALKQSGGKVYGPTGAAALLGLKPTTLYGKMRKLGIRRSDEGE